MSPQRRQAPASRPSPSRPTLPLRAHLSRRPTLDVVHNDRAAPATQAPSGRVESCTGWRHRARLTDDATPDLDRVGERGTRDAAMPPASAVLVRLVSLLRGARPGRCHRLGRRSELYRAHPGRLRGCRPPRVVRRRRAPGSWPSGYGTPRTRPRRSESRTEPRAASAAATPERRSHRGRGELPHASRTSSRLTRRPRVRADADRPRSCLPTRPRPRWPRASSTRR